MEFVAVDNPHANKLTVHILAAVAQHEREIISARTSAALQAAKARGKRLGNPKLADARRHAAAARRESADRYSANVLPVIQEIQRSGIKSLRGVARALRDPAIDCLSTPAAPRLAFTRLKAFQTTRLGMLNGFASSTDSSRCRLAHGLGRTTQPLRSSSITEPSFLLRAAPPLRPASVL